MTPDAMMQAPEALSRRSPWTSRDVVASVIRFLEVEGDQGLESAQRAAIVDVVIDDYLA